MQCYNLCVAHFGTFKQVPQVSNPVIETWLVSGTRLLSGEGDSSLYPGYGFYQGPSVNLKTCSCS